MKLISYSDAKITNFDIKNIIIAARKGWGKNHSKYINQFENKFKKKVGSKYAIATSSCTGALHIAIASLKLTRGDEVILCDSNWVATLSPIIHLGLIPKFVDAGLDDWCVNLKDIKNKITKKTKLIIVTHLYGNVANIENIIKFAKKKKIYVIEDAAEALGSTINGKMCGTLGDIGCYSFHASKIINTGEGGMMVTNNRKIFNKCEILANHGRTKKKYKSFVADEIGFKYKMTNLQAALGLSQLKSLNQNLQIKKKIFEYYLNYLKPIKFKTNVSFKNQKNSYWMTNIVFDKKYKVNIKFLIKFLKRYKIESRPFFPPLSMMKLFKNKYKNINSYHLYKNSINLPSSLNIKRSEIIFVCNKIKEYLNKHYDRR